MQQNTKGSSAVNDDKKKKKRLILIIIGVILLIAVVLAVLFLTKGDDRGMVITEDNAEEMKEQLAEPVEDGYYNTTMTVDWTFEDGKAVSSNAYVANSESNTRMVYFDVNLADTGELVYSSPYIPVGSELKEIKLDEDLDAGDYEAIVTYHLVDDDKEEITTVSVSINIHVLN